MDSKSSYSPGHLPSPGMVLKIALNCLIMIANNILQNSLQSINFPDLCDDTFSPGYLLLMTKGLLRDLKRCSQGHAPIQ